MALRNAGSPQRCRDVRDGCRLHTPSPAGSSVSVLAAPGPQGGQSERYQQHPRPQGLVLHRSSPSGVKPSLKAQNESRSAWECCTGRSCARHMAHDPADLGSSLKSELVHIYPSSLPMKRESMGQMFYTSGTKLLQNSGRHLFAFSSQRHELRPCIRCVAQASEYNIDESPAQSGNLVQTLKQA